MAFAPVFGRPFAATFSRRTAAAAVPWWLLGGVSVANAVAVYQPKGAASLAASYVNLANPGTYDAAPGTAPTFDATGWYGNNTKYLTTGITPASGWSALCRFSGLSTGDNDQVVMGSLTGVNSDYFFLQPRFVNLNNRYYANGGISAAVTGRITEGVMAVAGSVGYLNGLSDVTGIGAWSGTGKPIFLLAVNSNDIPLTQVTGYIQAVAIYNATLTATQVLAISNAMAAL